MDAEHYNVPIFSTSPANSRQVNAKRRFLGTGFFVGCKRSPILVTAKHVITCAGGGVSFDYRSKEDQSERRIIRVLPRPRLHPKLDVAVFDLQPLACIRTSPLILDQPTQVEDIYCFEYSRTYATPNTMRIEQEMWFRKGNTTGFLHIDGAEHVKTSFPAIRGSSGAPIWMFQRPQFCVAGMIVQERGHWLTEPTGDDRGARRKVGQEDDRYYLPYGVALAVEPLARALGDLDVKFEIARRGFRVRMARWLSRRALP